MSKPSSDPDRSRACSPSSPTSSWVIEHLQALRCGQGRTVWKITVEIDESANPQFYSTIDARPNARFALARQRRGGSPR